MTTLGELNRVLGGKLRSAAGRSAAPISRWDRSRPTAGRSSRATCSGPCRARTTTAPISSARPSAAAPSGVVVRQGRQSAPVPLGAAGRRHVQALVDLAAWKRRQFTGTVIAVTGSVGKTTTRQMIHTVLQSRLGRHGQPAELQQPRRRAAEHVGHRAGPRLRGAGIGREPPRRDRRAGRFVQPKVGVITQVGDAHLGGFGSRQGIAEAKAELLAALPAGRPRRPGRRPLAPRTLPTTARRRSPGSAQLTAATFTPAMSTRPPAG